MISRRSRLAWLAALILLVPGNAAAQGLTISLTAAMVKGPRTAPVTIVEFSDYQ